MGAFFANEAMDKPFQLNNTASLPYVRMLGQVLGIKEMENATPGDLSSPAVTRATNLGGMIAAALVRLPADRREAALEDIGGLAWTQNVLRTANFLNGKLPASDAVHFSLTLFFILGVTEDQLKLTTPNVVAYKRALALAQPAQNAARGQSLGFKGFGLRAITDGGGVVTPTTTASGAGSTYRADTGAAPSTTTQQAKAADEGPKLVVVDGLLRNTVTGKVFTKAETDTFLAAMAQVEAGARNEAAAQVSFSPTAVITDLLNVAANWTSDILCTGFRALFPRAIADTLCSIFQFLIRGVTGILASVVEMVFAVLNAVNALITGFVRGQPKTALLDFFRYLTEAIFFLCASYYTIPFLTDTNPNNPAAVSEAIAKVKRMADAAAAKDPIYPLTLTLGVISAVTMPTPQTLLGLGMTLVPIISVLIADPISKLPALVQIVQKYGAAVLEEGIAKFLRLGIMLTQGVIALSDTVAAVSNGISSKVQKDGFFATMLCDMAGDLPPATPGGPARKKTATWCTAQVLRRFANAFNPKNPQSVTAAIISFKTKKIADAAVDILRVVPVLLLALAGGAVEADPTLKTAINQWFATANAVPGMLSVQDTAQVRTAVKDLLDNLPADDQAQAVADAQKSLDLQNAAKLVAQTLWDRVGRDGVSTADRTAFFTAMRSTWVANGGKV